MAKAIMTFEDGESGSVTLAIDFEPAARTDEPMTSAQQLAVDLMVNAKKIASEWREHAKSAVV